MGRVKVREETGEDGAADYDKREHQHGENHGELDHAEESHEDLGEALVETDIAEHANPSDDADNDLEQVQQGFHLLVENLLCLHKVHDEKRKRVANTLS